ncbi:hypothetical protein FOXG_09985 [Fusarium oxysporum f. sp. lycopersici 4287]|uniref:C2H2-type domain-containing protein n=2 Tax=Fusarium oxysporum TaxID=5507 RepID=A0A0J9VER4_FUSO4|nr:hypothetical protein FOXG_09985 [Fusarium oxysporum f. sp. lycopersici 4287]EXK28305.1 hypothetical protein FOMG_15292 [Fusarium oxysporum f. sp. melonis 26406]KNB09391.1 hypothetical protein FOXG_09985 [Fusarium oxysporum f. sp. lycopersici 4287]
MGSSAPRRPPSDDVDGDILTFSELDFARLGLANRTIDERNTPIQDQGAQQSYFPPQNDEFSFGHEHLDFTDDLLNSMIPPEQQSEFWLDPALSLNSWETPAAAQPPTGGNISPLATSGNRAGTPTTTSPFGVPGFGQSFNGSPIAENSQRGLPRKRSHYFRRQPHRTGSDPISIPRHNHQRDSALDPMQRWQESPPEAEAASLSAIADALKKTPLRTRSSAGSLGRSRVGSRAGSTHSLGSATSCSSASVGSPQSATRKGSLKGRVTKSKRSSTTKGNEPQNRRFPCTFCCDKFKSKYDWARHEKSLHLDLAGWRCAPFGGVVVSPETGRNHCAYCSQLDPTPEHLETHNHAGCQNDDKLPVFSRKDHLTQHLRLVHHVKTVPVIESWKVEGPPVKSRCGICGLRMEAWKERVEHLAKHFRKGDTMADWKGDHDFEPHVKARVTNALSPYMIEVEGKCPVPFSATDPSCRDHLLQIRENVGRTTDFTDGGLSNLDAVEETVARPQHSMTQDSSSMAFPEFLVHHLGRYAQRQMSLGVIPTDEMFQTEARRIVYDTADPWDQTLADNKDWLSCFKEHHVNGSPGN